MVRGTTSKLIFVDSSVSTDGRGHTKVLIPPHPFSAQGGERMALTLVSFTMRRNWYNLNATNNTFYLFVSNTYHEVVITPGVYSSFAALAGAINAALTTTTATIAAIATSTVNYNDTTRFFSIVLTMTAGSEAIPVQLKCFAIKGGTLPVGVSLQGGLSDSHEILGVTPIRSSAQAADSSNGGLNAGINTLRSKYPASLNTLDALYLHMNTIETGHFMSTGYESHAQESLRLIESSIFARIPFDDSTFTEAHEVVSFEDSGGDMYQSFLSRKNIESLDIRVTDARGRSLAVLNPSQAEDGLLAFRLCLRWDLFVPPPTPQKDSVKLEKPPSV